MSSTSDTIVVGGGIVGLACAWEAARRGRSVVLIERDTYAQSASVRNFGMIWPVGQQAGEHYERALRSRDRWLTLRKEAGIWLQQCGSLHLAHHEIEAQVLQELASNEQYDRSSLTMLTAKEIASRFPLVRTDRLLTGMYSASECVVDPPKAIRQLTRHLVEHHSVRIIPATAVVAIDMPTVTTAGGERYRAEQVLVCTGSDFSSLFPQEFKVSGLRRCKLQMLAAAAPADGVRVGVHLAAGLTLAHYKAFESCPSLAELKAYLAHEYPEHLKYGIHVMASQHESGELILGDSHLYEGDIEFTQHESIDKLILDYLQRMLVVPTERITRRWYGIYAKHATKVLFTATPQPGCTIINGVGGAGMTMSFGHIEHWWNDTYGTQV